MNPARHVLRIAVICFLAGIVVFNYYNALAQQIGSEKEIRESFVLSTLHGMLEDSPQREPITTFARGTLWSMHLGPLSISDPLAVIESTLRTKSLHWPLILSAAIPVALALLLGRVFCGWLCPMGLFSEIITGARRLITRIGIDFPAPSFPNGAKYVVAATGLAVALIGSTQVFFYFYPPRLVPGEVYQIIRTGAAGFASFFIAALLLIELVFIKRFWCRCLCPGGAVLSLLGAKRLLRIRRDTHKCISCGHCDDACPHELAPSNRVLGGECDNCGLCRAACPTRAISYGISTKTTGPNEEEATE